MTIEEKWERMKNPKTLGDRDLFLTSQEMLQIKEFAWIHRTLDDHYIESKQKKK